MLSDEVINGKLCRQIAFDGEQYLVHSSAGTALNIIALFADEELDAETKANVLFPLLFVDPEDVVERCPDIRGLLCACVWNVARLDIDGSHSEETGGEKVIDFTKDEESISVSVYTMLGKPMREIIATMNFAEFSKLIAYAPDSTPIGRAIYYRTASEPKPNGHNQDQITAFRKAKDFYSLELSEEEKRTRAERQFDAVFESMRRMAVKQNG